MLDDEKFKKFFMLLSMLSIMMCSCTAFANYPTHLYGDKNFILCDGHMGSAWYVDRSSLNVQKYEPPQYIIAVNVVRVDNADRRSTEIKNVHTYRFFYNSDLGQMYVDFNNNDNWRYLNPQGSWAETGISMPAGEIAFVLAYNYKFYGDRAYYSDDFYNRIF